MFKNKRISKKSGSYSKGFKSLFTRILTFVGLPVVITFLLVSFVLLSLVNNAVTRLTTNELSAKSLAASYSINNYFEKHLEIVKTLAGNSELETLFTSVKPGIKIGDYDNFPQIKSTLENVQNANPESVMSVWIVDIDSSQLAQADGYLSEESWDVQKRPWFIQMKSVNSSILTDPYEDTSTKLQVVTVASPIFKPDTQEIIGVAGIDFSLETLSETIKGYTLGEKGFYILSTGAGQIIYHPVAENINKNIADTDMSENIKEALLSKSEGSLSYTSHGIKSHGYVSPVGKTGWTVTTGLPNDEFKQEFFEVRTAMLATFAIAIAAIMAVLLILSSQIVAPIKALTKTANMIAEGNLDVSAEVSSRDEIGQMADAINRTVIQLRQYIAYIKEITSTLENMALGDMRIHLKEDYVGEFASIRSAFTMLSNSLNHTLRTIDTAAEQVSAGSSQVASGAQALASGSTEQAASVEELSASIERIAEHVSENSSNVIAAAGYIEQAGTAVNEGNEHMKQLAGAMAEINSASNQIANITKVIEDIAFQTNILALNAAIEAARAGNAGKGFAVVADEVRSLAAKSAEAVRQTGELIEASVATVKKGTEITTQTSHILQDVSEKTVKVSESFDKIEKASAEQTLAIEQIKDGITQVSAVVQNNAATAEENSATSQEMSAQAATLREEVGKFKLDTETGNNDIPIMPRFTGAPEIFDPILKTSYELGKY
ncbi:methyl-accepting chemotaxis protein [Anaeropeptidivorans aminofermentans]|uniref:methyl-accepting chemotaxis protein n=1 Tax=Anaeropeptidivorans aminofermentans TaxID=2934315 RepID=UPI0020253507|nr:methyl-accepting chemotaxis protein [Anaeropeptidivorans aminofermentans]